MGKGTDKLYITHSEWSSEDAFGASAGAGLNKQKILLEKKMKPQSIAYASTMKERMSTKHATSTNFSVT